MKLLISIEELHTKKCNEKIPLECEECKSVFTQNKGLVLRGLKGTRKVSCCSNECRKKCLSKSLKNFYTNPTPLESKHNITKKILMDIIGGKCQSCGYNKSQSALTFHHRNPSDKSFQISSGISRKYSMDKLVEETKKCILLCSNCHHEHHDGLLTIE